MGKGNRSHSARMWVWVKGVEINREIMLIKFWGWSPFRDARYALGTAAPSCSPNFKSLMKPSARMMLSKNKEFLCVFQIVKKLSEIFYELKIMSCRINHFSKTDLSTDIQILFLDNKKILESIKLKMKACLHTHLKWSMEDNGHSPNKRKISSEWLGMSFYLA
jgi:hypothetical protein